MLKPGKDIKHLTSNFISLVILQGLNYALPLLMFPYLIRVLGPENFGLIAFSQAFIQYFVVLTDYGFSLSATYSISIHRNDSQKVSEIVSSVMIIKILLTCIGLIILILLILLFDKFSDHWYIHLLTFGLVIGNVLNPVWLFQGLEQMRYITIMNAFSKALYATGIFLFVKTSTDYLYVPLVNTIGLTVSGIISFVFVKRYFKLKFFIPSKDILISTLKEGSAFFLSRASVTIYTSSNSFILGLFSSNLIVGYYSIAEKLYIALQNIYSALNSVLYPYMSRTHNVKLFKLIFLFVVLVNALISLFTYFYAEKIIYLVSGHSNLDSAQVLREFVVVNLFVVPSVLLGYPFLGALKHAWYANYSVILGSMCHIVLLSTMVVFYKVTIFNLPFLILITEIVVLVFRIYGIKKEKIW